MLDEYTLVVGVKIHLDKAIPDEGYILLEEVPVMVDEVLLYEAPVMVDEVLLEEAPVSGDEVLA